jgi:hypothetical protein
MCHEADSHSVVIGEGEAGSSDDQAPEKDQALRQLGRLFAGGLLFAFRIPGWGFTRGKSRIRR